MEVLREQFAAVARSLARALPSRIPEDDETFRTSAGLHFAYDPFIFLSEDGHGREIRGWCIPGNGTELLTVRAVAGGKVLTGLYGLRRQEIEELHALRPFRDLPGWAISIPSNYRDATAIIQFLDVEGRWLTGGKINLGELATRDEANPF